MNEAREGPQGGLGDNVEGGHKEEQDRLAAEVPEVDPLPGGGPEGHLDRTHRALGAAGADRGVEVAAAAGAHQEREREELSSSGRRNGPSSP